MATCGYICPKCEGRGFLLDNLATCDWCKKPNHDFGPITPKNKVTITDEEWIKSVHESNCCSDIGALTENNSSANFASK